MKRPSNLMGKRGAEGGQLIAPSSGGRDDSDDEEPTGPMPVADAGVLAQRKCVPFPPGVHFPLI